MTARNPQEKAMRTFVAFAVLCLAGVVTAVVLVAWLVYWIVKG